MKAIRFSLQNLRREFHSGELRAMAIALIIAVSAITSVGFFSDRIHRALQMLAGELIAADLVVLSSEPTNLQWIKEANRRGLDTAQTITFPSIGMANDKSQLVSVKAVSETYPLRGSLQVTDIAYGEGTIVNQTPAQGKVCLTHACYRS